MELNDKLFFFKCTFMHFQLRWSYVFHNKRKKAVAYQTLSKMSAHYVSDFFIINQWVLKLGALWGPDNDNILKKLYNLYAIGTTLFVNLFFTTTEFVSFADTYGNEYDLIKNISFALTHLLGAMKVSMISC